MLELIWHIQRWVRNEFVVVGGKWRKSGSKVPYLASRKRCDLKTRKRCDFYPAAPKNRRRFFCDFFAIFLRFLRQNLRFSTLRFENAAIFLRLRFFGTPKCLNLHKIDPETHFVNFRPMAKHPFSTHFCAEFPFVSKWLLTDLNDFELIRQLPLRRYRDRYRLESRDGVNREKLTVKKIIK